MDTTTRTPQQRVWPLIWLGIAMVVSMISGATPTPDSASATNSSAGFVAVEDTFIQESRAKSNYGTKASLEVGANRAVRRTLTRFRVTGIPDGATVTSATLGLFVTNPSDHSSLVHRVNGPWSEGTTTWSNAPGVGGLIGSSEGNSVLRTWSDFNVTSAVTGNGTFDFYLVSSSHDGASYAARESSTNRPSLNVRWTAPAIVPSPTLPPLPAPTASASATPTPTPVSTPAPTPTPIPTRAPTAAPTLTPTPTLGNPPGPGPASGFVTANGRSLSLAGNPYRFVGVNRYNLLTIDPPGAAPYRGCGASWPDADLAAWFNELAHQGVDSIRLWLFQLFTASGTDFSRFDHVLNLAGERNIKIIPVLENQWTDCTQGGDKHEPWYKTGYLSPYGNYTLSLKDYTAIVVDRYKDDDRILMWQIMNEAGISLSGGGCGSPTIFRSMADDIATDIQSLDPNHLVSFGTMGGGQCGASGEDYKSLHALASIDVCEYHDYNSPTVAMPGDQWNGLQMRFNQCNSLNKPLFIGEAGIKSNCSDAACYTPQQRAGFFNAKMNAFFGAGGVGYAIWSYRDKIVADPLDYGAADPLVPVMASY